MTARRMPCGYERPRGGGCSRQRVWIVEAGDRATGPHALSGACDEHLNDVRAWAFRITDQMPETKIDPLRSGQETLL